MRVTVPSTLISRNTAWFAHLGYDLTVAGMVASTVLADDLTGAVEAAAALLPWARTARVLLGPSPVDLPPPEMSRLPEAIAVDLDSRERLPSEARGAISPWLQHCGQAPALVKIDSLLRGNVSATLAELTALGHPTVFAPAHPRMGRVVLNARPLVRNRPLHHVEAWAYENSPAPYSVLDLVPEGTPAAHLSLAVVRSSSLPHMLAKQLCDGLLVSCDATTERDLRAIASAALPLPRLRLVGTAALAAALGDALTRSSTPPKPEEAPPPAATKPILIVNGSREATAGEQVALLHTLGIVHIAVSSPPDGARNYCDRLLCALTSQPVAAISIAGDFEDRFFPADLLASVVAAVLGAGVKIDLVVLGGRTSRLILDKLQIRSLAVTRPLGHGAVECHTDSDLRIVTRPGSFGPKDHLRQITDYLLRGHITEDD